MEVKSYSILVVDDNEAIRSLVSVILEKLGLKVSSADNGKRGMDLFVNSKFDLVVTDFNMPGMNGIDLANKIKVKSPSTVIVLMTGEEKEFILSIIKDTGVDRAIFKPFSFSEMAETVQRLLQA